MSESRKQYRARMRAKHGDDWWKDRSLRRPTKHEAPVRKAPKGKRKKAEPLGISGLQKFRAKDIVPGRRSRDSKYPYPPGEFPTLGYYDIPKTVGVATTYSGADSGVDIRIEDWGSQGYYVEVTGDDYDEGDWALLQKKPWATLLNWLEKNAGRLGEWPLRIGKLKLDYYNTRAATYKGHAAGPGRPADRLVIRRIRDDKDLGWEVTYSPYGAPKRPSDTFFGDKAWMMRKLEKVYGPASTWDGKN